MTRETLRVTFQPEGRTVFVLRGTKAVEAAGQAGIVLHQPCGGEGTCGKCRVEVLENAPAPSAADRSVLTPEEMDFPGVDEGVQGVKFIEKCVESSKNGAIWINF